MKRIIIIGATSGLGKETAILFANAGWKVGIAGRREHELRVVKASNPEAFEYQRVDITAEDAPQKLNLLIEQLGGMDLFLLSSGVGNQNIILDPNIEIRTIQTNCEGFVRVVTAAFNYFKINGGGHIGVISSIAGTKGLGSAPAYSASKRFQNTYIDALAQLSNMEKLGISFTDIRPGFVKTDLLNDGKNYPMLMDVKQVSGMIVNALLGKKRVAILDKRYAILVFFWRLIPRFVWERFNIKSE